MICRICGNKENNAIVTVTEKMFGSKELFEYIHCDHCGCLQLLDENMDMTPYYPPQYFSLNDYYKPNKLKDFLGKKIIVHRLGKISLIGFLSQLIFKSLSQSWIKKGYFDFDSKILDVGCGSGRLLHLLYKRGFKNLTGVEPFNSENIKIENTINIYKKTIFEVDEKFDFIMLNYSFEHSPFPHNTIKKITELLNNKGSLLIRIPILDSYSYEKYGDNWVQMDAPRHIYLYTLKSIVSLCKQYGLVCKETIFDSTEYQFIQSEKYVRNLKYSDSICFSKKELRNYKRLSKNLNKQNKGDQVSMYFVKQ